MTSVKPVLTKPKIANQKVRNIQRSQRNLTPRDNSTIDINNYEIISKIKQSTFGLINKVRNKYTNDVYASKTSLTETKSQHPIFISREIRILMNIQHPTIIKFYGYSHYDFNGDKNITFLMDYFENGSLMDLIIKESKGLLPSNFTNTQKQIILVGISLGMMILHSRHIIHRDLKSDNILLDKNYQPKITDFGLSKIYDPLCSMKQSKSNCGTLPYMAPEVINGNEFNTKADVYSFGILMYEVVGGCVAYHDEISTLSPFKFQENVLKGHRPKFNFPIKKGLKTMIKKCWSHNPDERPTFCEIFNKLSLSQDDSFFQLENCIYDPVINMFIDDGDMTEYGSTKFCLENVDMDELFEYIEKVMEQTSLKNHQDEISLLKKENQQLLERVSFLEQKVEKLISVVDQSSSTFQVKPPAEPKNSEELKPSSFLRKPLPEPTPISVKPPTELKKSDSTAFSVKPPTELKKSDSSSFARKVTPLKIKEDSNSIGYFNTLAVKQQQKIIADIISASSSKNNLFISLNSLLCYLDKNVQIDSKPSLKIIAQEGNDDDLSKIDGNSYFYLFSSAIKVMHEKNLLQSNDFTNILKELKKVYFELEFPTNWFSQAYEVVTKYKSSYSIDTKISIFITTVSKTSYMFTNNMSIHYVIIGDTVKAITGKQGNKNDGSFSNCSSLEIVEIAPSVTSIGSYAFYNCQSLRKIEIPSSVKSIGDYAFYNCSNLKQVEIPDSVTSIGQYAFDYCSNLKQVEIPDSVTSIGECAFENCSRLAQISIPPSITSISSSIFTYCSDLKKVEIPNSVKSIGPYSFHCCTSLTQISIPTSVDSIGVSAFYNTSLEEIEIPSSVTFIGVSAFSSCSKLKKIEIPSSVTYICDYTFNGCTSLSHVTIPPSLKSIGSYAFHNCKSLSHIAIPPASTEISQSVFEGCLSFTVIAIPSSVVTIKKRAFYGCSSLAEVEFQSSLKQIESEAFDKCNFLTDVTIPSAANICQNSFPSQTRIIRT